MSGIGASVRRLVTSPFARSTSYVFMTQAFSGVVGFALNLILIRSLPVDHYGVFSLYSSAAMLAAGLLHLGWLDAFGRFGSKYAGGEQYLSVKAHFLKKILVTVAVFSVIALALSGWISRMVYQRENFEAYFRLAILNGAVLCFWSFTSLDFQVRQQFRKYFTSQVLMNGSRLAAVVALYFLAQLNLVTAIGVNFGLPLLFLFLYWKRVRGAPVLTPAVVSEATTYRNWLLVSTISNAIIGNIDLSILAHYHPNQTLAQYGVASRLTLPLHMVMASLSMVLLPKLASNTDLEVTRSQLRKLVKVLLPAGAVLGGLCFVLPPILARWAGGEYAESQEVIRYFLLAAVIVFITNPPSVFLSAWGHTRMLAGLNLAQLVVDLLLDLWWIPEQGALGAIKATVVVFLMGTVFAYFQLWRALRGDLKPV